RLLLEHRVLVAIARERPLREQLAQCRDRLAHVEVDRVDRGAVRGLETDVVIHAGQQLADVEPGEQRATGADRPDAMHLLGLTPADQIALDVEGTPVARAVMRARDRSTHRDAHDDRKGSHFWIYAMNRRLIPGASA